MQSLEPSNSNSKHPDSQFVHWISVRRNSEIYTSRIGSVKLQVSAVYDTKFYGEVTAAADCYTNNNPVVFVVPVQLQGMIIRESYSFNL